MDEKGNLWILDENGQRVEKTEVIARPAAKGGVTRVCPICRKPHDPRETQCNGKPARRKGPDAVTAQVAGIVADVDYAARLAEAAARDKDDPAC